MEVGNFSLFFYFLGTFFGNYIYNLTIFNDCKYLLSQNILYFNQSNGTALFKIVNNYFNTNIYSYLETSSGQSYNPYLNVVHLNNTSFQ